jgi:hypothetical protein
MLVGGAATLGAAYSQALIAAELDYGWKAALEGHPVGMTGVSGATGKRLVQTAQTELNCCGFGYTSMDRSVTPCPSGAKHGCELALLEEARLSLFVLAGLEGAAGLLAFFTVVLVACNAEAIKAAQNRGEAPTSGSEAVETSGGVSSRCSPCVSPSFVFAQGHRPPNSWESLYASTRGYYIPGGAASNSGFLQNAGVSWDEHAVIGGGRGARSEASTNSSLDAPGAVIHRGARSTASSGGTSNPT